MVDEALEQVRVLRSIGRTDDYLAEAVALAEAHPTHVGAQIEAAYACDRFGSEQDAIGYYDTAWQLGIPAAERRSFLVGYGSTLRNVDRTDESVAVLRAAVAEFPEFPAMQAFLALSLHSAGNHGDALATMLGVALAIGHESGALGAYDRALRHYQGQLRAGD